MPEKKLAFLDTLNLPLSSRALGADLIVVRGPRSGKWGGARVVALCDSWVGVMRGGGIAVVLNPDLLSDSDKVPDPVVIFVSDGKPSKEVAAAAKKRGAHIVELFTGTIITAKAFNHSSVDHGCILEVVVPGRAVRVRKPPKVSKTPNPLPEHVEPPVAPETP